jgi:hypothetical protein
MAWLTPRRLVQPRALITIGGLLAAAGSTLIVVAPT